MRPIKFRARDINGKIYFGSFDEDTNTIDCWDIAETVVVKRDTVAQLVGYDKDGKEVYEGDIIIDENDEEMPAMLLAIQFNGKLKEAEK